MSRQMHVCSSTKRENLEEKYLGESESTPRGRQDEEREVEMGHTYKKEDK